MKRNSIILSAVTLIVTGMMTASVCAETAPTADVPPPADYDSEIDKSAQLITPEAVAALGALLGPSNAVALAHAMKLTMTAYDLDMQTPAGRKRWHGKLIKEEFPTNSAYKIEVYSNDVDHAVWRYRVRCKQKPKAYPWPQLVQIGTNGVPARLAAIRARRNSELARGTVVTNIEVNANAPKTEVK